VEAVDELEPERNPERDQQQGQRARPSDPSKKGKPMLIDGGQVGLVHRLVGGGLECGDRSRHSDALSRDRSVLR